MDLIMDPEKTPEEILLESFYVLKELHRNMPLTTELVEDYFQKDNSPARKSYQR